MKKALLVLGCIGLLISACTQKPVVTIPPTIDPAILTQIASTQDSISQPTIELIIPTATMTA
ncbi:MAG: hypothetical protein WCF08_08930, partial [Anaerolineaceae bacterium]